MRGFEINLMDINCLEVAKLWEEGVTFSDNASKRRYKMFYSLTPSDVKKSSHLKGWQGQRPSPHSRTCFKKKDEIPQCLTMKTLTKPNTQR